VPKYRKTSTAILGERSVVAKNCFESDIRPTECNFQPQIEVNLLTAVRRSLRGRLLRPRVNSRLRQCVHMHIGYCKFFVRPRSDHHSSQIWLLDAPLPAVFDRARRSERVLLIVETNRSDHNDRADGLMVIERSTRCILKCWVVFHISASGVISDGATHAINLSISALPASLHWLPLRQRINITRALVGHGCGYRRGGPPKMHSFHFRLATPFIRPS